jgi:hypothetical protein
MLGQFAIRVALGGAIVLVFSVIGQVFKPKTFAGMFGAAPSVALASLALAACEHDKDYAAVEARSMLIGALALFVYGTACVAATKRQGWPVWLSATLAWGLWFAVALGLFFLARATGTLS